jgi:dTDP-4-amino-4,6-dideoxygalactose transaminase
MTSDQQNRTVFDAAHPVDDRYSPPACGELNEIQALLVDGRLSGGAAILPRYEQALASWFGAKRAIAVNSGSSALYASLIALGVKHGSEVLIPATAPLPTAMPIFTCGATPVIVDTLPGSLALDPDDVEDKLTPRTRAAITLPLWGYPADDHAAETVLEQAGIPIVEDACQAHGTRIRGRCAGTLGRVGCLSTHDRKPLSTGEGGFVLTDDEDLADRLDFYTHLGHLRGQVTGVNAKLAAPLAAIGIRRLDGLTAQLAARRANAARLLDQLPPNGRLRELGYGPQDAPNYYNLVLLVSGDPAPVAAELAAAGLPPDSIRFGYRPLYHQPIFSRYATRCPNAEQLAANTMQLPVHPALSKPELQWIADRLTALATGESTRS